MCGTLSDAELAQFAREVAYEEAYRQLDLPGVDWEAVQAVLVAALAERPDLGAEWVEASWTQATSLNAAGKWAEAEVVLREALGHPRSAGPYLGWIHSSLAQSLQSQERWREALEHLDLADLERERAAGPDSFGPWLDGTKADVWSQIGMPDLAHPLARARWERERDDPDENARWGAFECWVRCLTAADDYAALSELERELRENGWLERLDPARRARAEHRFAYVLVERGQFQPAANAEARRRLRELLEGGRLGQREERWALASLIQADLDADDVIAAREGARRLGEWLGGPDAPETERDHRTDRVTLAALEGLLAASEYDRGERVEGLESALEHVRAAWMDVRRGWANLPTRDGGIGYLFHSRRQILVEALLALELRIHGPRDGAFRALDWLIEAQSESTLARRLGAAATTGLAAARTLLPSGRGMIVWIPARGRSFAVAVDATRGLLVELGPVAHLEARAGELARAAAAAVRAGDEVWPGEFEQAIAAATDAFLPEHLLEFAAPWSELYIGGLDDVGNLPFELLTDSGGSQGTARAVSRIPSLPALLALRDRRSGEHAEAVVPTVLLAVADSPRPDAAASFRVAALDVPDDLVKELRRGWARGALREATGTSATPDALASMLDDSCAFAHLVAHGIRRTHERPHGILLAGSESSSGAVFAEDLEAWRSPPLVLLSVCSPANSELRRGDSSRSDAVAALFVAGAASVAAAGLDLDLGPTLRVGSRVQGELQSGASLAAALRAVRSHFAGAGVPRNREWLAAHLLQVSGDGFDVRLPANAVRRPTRMWGAASFLAAGLALAVGWLVRRARHRA